MPDGYDFALRDGTPVVVRAIRDDDGPWLVAGLKRLSDRNKVQRFLYHRTNFSSEELNYLTHCDQRDHIALIIARRDREGREVDRFGVARSVRDKDDPAMAEVAIVITDDLQRLGAGTFLLQTLARLAWDQGIRRWQAFSFVENTAIRALLHTVGSPEEERILGFGTVELIHRLRPPEEYLPPD